MTLPQVNNRDELIHAMDASIESLLLASVRATVGSPPGDGVKMAGFILGACLIDTLAGFYAGIDENTYTKGTGKRFKTFVSKYLDEYNADSDHMNIKRRWTV